MLCLVCDAECHLRCGGCKEVYYCGMNCQRIDRKNHKTVCGDYAVNHIKANYLKTITEQDPIKREKMIDKYTKEALMLNADNIIANYFLESMTALERIRKSNCKHA